MRLRDFVPTVSPLVLPNPFASKTFLKSNSVKRVSRPHSIRASCTSNLDDVYPYPNHDPLGNNNKLHFAISNNKSPFSDDHDSFLNSGFDFLEPMMLGIKPDYPDWLDQETANIEQKANSLDIPLSLRMIKKKLKWEEGLSDSKELTYCSVKAAFASMVFIVVELQSSALRTMEALRDDDLNIVTNKVQKEMHSSFVWLFQHVFSKTPSLMLDVMVLLANFGVYSVSNNVEIGGTSLTRALVQEYPQISSSLSSLVDGNSSHLYHQLESVEEMNLWKSMLDDAIRVRGVGDDDVLDHETKKNFVSPVYVELEHDHYDDYLRTDLLYQMNLSQEPNNPLFLCNYAQYLHLVARDYERAEECFKRAVQVLPPDSESLSQYANFLWMVRKDYMGAEESFLQSLAIEPDNSYYASRYANFLWSTGGEETCFPLNHPNS